MSTSEDSVKPKGLGLLLKAKLKKVVVSVKENQDLVARM